MAHKRTYFSTVQSALSKIYGKLCFKAICLNRLLMQAFTSLALLTQTCFVLFRKSFAIKILVQFTSFTCFVDVWYFDKLRKQTISNSFSLNKQFTAENVCILLTFLQNKEMIVCFHICVHHCARSKNLHFNQRK